MLGLSNGARDGLTGFVAGLSRKTVINNVTINGLLLGPFDTDRLRGPVAKMDADKRGITVDQLLAEGAKLNPAGRFGHPDEFGQACAFLCSFKGGLHYRAEHPARRRRVPGHALGEHEMKAVWYERTGPAADVLTFGEMRTLIGGPGEVRVWLCNGQRNGRAFCTAAEYIALSGDSPLDSFPRLSSP